MATTDQKDLSIQMVHIDDQKDVHQLYPKTKDKNVTIESTNKALPTGITTLKDVVDKLGDSAFSSSTVIGITADERNKLKGIEAGAQVNMVDGVKGDAETYYRTGDVNITKANIGLGSVENKSSATIRSEITSLNVTSALGYTPPKQDTTYNDATTKVHGLMSTDDKVKLDGIAPGAQVNSITGVKGDNETTYRTGNVNITKANIGLTNVEDKSSATIRGELTSKNVTDALGYAPPRVNTTYEEATTTTDGLLSSEDKTKLDSIESGAQKNTVTGVKGYNESAYRRGDIVITKANIGLTNVEDKSSATIRGELTSKNVTDALGYTPPKQDTTYPPANGSTLGLIKTGGSLTLTSGVATVNDNSHKHTIANITNLQSSLDSKLNASLKGAKNGLAELDENGLVPSAQLPSYVDDVIEVNMGSDLTSATLADDSPVTPEAGKIYVDLTSNKTYRWSGTSFVVISETLALGETSSTAFDGARGKVAYNHSQSAHARVDATLTQPSVTNGNIKINGTETSVYLHPSYTAQKSGLYKVTVDGKGHVSAVSAVTKADITALGIPGQDTNTTYDVATTSTNGLLSSTDKAKLDGIASGANNYTHPSYTSRTSGLYKITVDGTGHVSAVASVTKSDITALGIPGQDTNTTYGTMVGASSSANGSTGLVPAPEKGDSSRYLRSDGTWVTPPNTTYNDATTSTHGLMTAAMVSKLNGIASGAQVNTVNSVAGKTGAVTLSKSDVGLGNVDNTADSAKSVKYATTAGSASSVSWGNVSGKPSTFTPSSHTHNSIDIIDLNGTDLNTLKDNTFKSYYAGGENTNTNKPSDVDAFGMISYRAANGYYVQELYSNTGAKYIRMYDGLSRSWTGWERIYTTSYKPSKSDVGLGNVDNTADSAKSVKYATTAGSANSVTWSNVSGKPSTYYTHPGYTAHSSGLYKVTVDSTGHVSAVSNVTKSDITALGVPGSDTTYGSMKGATTNADGATGLVPAPSKGDSSRYLRSDGTWVTPPNTTYNDATTSAHGLMTAAMVSKLNGIASGANAYSHPTYSSHASGLYKVTVDGTGHVSAVASVTKADITALGIPGQDTNTTYGVVSSSSNGLMSPTMLNTLNSVNSAIGGKYSSSGGTLNGDITFPAIGDTGSSKGINWSGSTDGARIYYKTTAKDAGHLVFQASDDSDAVIDFEWIIGGTVSRKSYISSDGVYHGTATYATSAGSANSVSWGNVSGKPSTYYTHPGYTAHSSGLYKVTVDGSGHVSAVSNVTKSDITALGIPGQDTNTWRGIQDNLTSSATDQSLSANQGRILKSLVDGKAAASHTHPYISTSVNYVLITDETNLTAYDASSAKWNAPS